MNDLSLAWFGPGSAHIGDQPVQFRTRKAEALLIYLTTEAALHGGAPVRREALLGLLWPDYPEKSARQSLRTNLSYLRTALSGMNEAEATPPFLTGDSRTVRINLDANVTLDVAQFTRLIGEVAAHQHQVLTTCADCRRRLERAVDLCTGDFLEGFYLSDGGEFEAWVATRRESLRRLMLDALEDMAAICIVQADLEAAEAYARRQITIDPLRESAHCQLMTAMARMGQRPAAVSHYEILKQMLREDVGLQPSSETRALYEAILDGELTSDPIEPRGSTPTIKEGESGEADLKSTSAVPHNLPPQPTSFVGRQDELDQLAAYLTDPQVCLITIVGAGGMGKTRLAIAAAEPFAADLPHQPLFPHGVYFVALSPLETAGHIAQAIADEFDVQLQRAGELLTYLRRKRLLLVLDNFEHLIEGATMVAEIVQAAPGVKIIVTSRERLRLQQEQVFPIEGLSVPESMFAEQLMEYAAVALFLQAARRVQPGFSPSQSELATLVDICRRLEGMPLAIELAAAWIDTISLADIAAELQSSIDLLETKMRNLPARQRSMRAIFDASFGRLGERERAVLGRLSPFRGGITRPAAQQVAGATLSILSRLVNKSLVQFQPAEQRYHVHELLRQYTFERMNDSGELESARDAHSDYFLNFVRERQHDMKGRRQVAALKEISREFKNVRAAWLWATQRRHYEAIGVSMDSLFLDFCDRLQRYEDGVELQQQAVDLLAPKTNEVPHPVWYRLLSRHLRPRENEKPQIERALAFARQQGNRPEIAHCIAMLGWAGVMTGDIEPGIRRMKEGIGLFRELGDISAVALWLTLVGMGYQRCGRVEKALTSFLESLALHRELDDLAYVARTLGALMTFLRQIGRFAESEARLRELVVLREEIGVRRLVATSQLELALASFLKGGFEETESLVRRASSIIAEAGGPGLSADFELGLLANLNGRYEQAWQLHESFIEVAPWMGKDFDAVWGLSLTACCLGRVEIARQQLLTALELAVTSRGKGYVALALPVVALLFANLDKTEWAVELLALGYVHLTDATGWLEKWSVFVQLQDDVEATLGPDVFAVAWERGQKLDLWQTAEQLVGELAPD